MGITILLATPSQTLQGTLGGCRCEMLRVPSHRCFEDKLDGFAVNLTALAID